MAHENMAGTQFNSLRGRTRGDTAPPGNPAAGCHKRTHFSTQGRLAPPVPDAEPLPLAPAVAMANPLLLVRHSLLNSTAHSAGANAREKPPQKGPAPKGCRLLFQRTEKKQQYEGRGGRELVLRIEWGRLLEGWRSTAILNGDIRCAPYLSLCKGP